MAYGNESKADDWLPMLSRIMSAGIHGEHRGKIKSSILDLIRVAYARMLREHLFGIDEMLDVINDLSGEEMAEMIDPVCRYLPDNYPTWFDDDNVEHEDKTLLDFDGYSASCDRCGWSMMQGWFDRERTPHGWRIYPEFDYCPGCGARVLTIGRGDESAESRRGRHPRAGHEADPLLGLRASEGHA